MSKVTVDERALRDLVREVLDNRELGAVLVQELHEVDEEPPVNVNDVVDPSTAVTDPADDDGKPHNAAELQVAVGALSKEIPADQVPVVYDRIVAAMEAAADREEELNRGPEETTGDEMKNMKKDTHVEALIRRAVRSMLNEAGKKINALGVEEQLPDTGESNVMTFQEFRDMHPEYEGKSDEDLDELAQIDDIFLTDDTDESGWDPDTDDEEFTPPDKETEEEKFKRTGMRSLAYVAQHGGGSVSGIKRIAGSGEKGSPKGTALAKAELVAKYAEFDPGGYEGIELKALKNWVNYLSDELSPEEYKYMTDPNVLEVVKGTPGFLEYLNKCVMSVVTGGNIPGPDDPSLKYMRTDKRTGKITGIDAEFRNWLQSQPGWVEEWAKFFNELDIHDAAKKKMKPGERTPPIPYPRIPKKPPTYPKPPVGKYDPLIHEPEEKE